MFIGRERELQSLQEFYNKDGCGMMVIYGRRRIGKSTLITEFIKQKKVIFYTATKVGKERNAFIGFTKIYGHFMEGYKYKNHLMRFCSEFYGKQGIKRKESAVWQKRFTD